MNPPIFVNVTTDPADPQSAREVVRYDRFVRRLLKADTESMEACHIGLGLAGELGELYNATVKDDDTEIVEELGDLEFYLQAAFNHFEFEVADIAGEAYVDAEGDPLAVLSIGIGELVDCIKREYIYCKPRSREALKTAFAIILQGMEEIYTDLEIFRDAVLQANATKLEVRYAGLVYSNEAAQARADKN